MRYSLLGNLPIEEQDRDGKRGSYMQDGFGVNVGCWLLVVIIRGLA